MNVFKNILSELFVVEILFQIQILFMTITYEDKLIYFIDSMGNS